MDLVKSKRFTRRVLAYLYVAQLEPLFVLTVRFP